FHCARRTASRGEPGSKLLRRAFFISANLSHNMDAVTDDESRAANRESRAASPELLSKTWYWYYVLALLTICYIANVVDRSQVLAASLQAIKKEFNATDAQLGILSGLPFAIFYSFLGIPIA